MIEDAEDAVTKWRNGEVDAAYEWAESASAAGDIDALAALGLFELSDVDTLASGEQRLQQAADAGSVVGTRWLAALRLQLADASDSWVSRKRHQETARELLLRIPKNQWNAETGAQYARVCLKLGDVSSYAEEVNTSHVESILEDDSDSLTARARFGEWHLAALDMSGVQYQADEMVIQSFLTSKGLDMSRARPFLLTAAIQYKIGNLIEAKKLMLRVSEQDRSIDFWIPFSWINILLGTYTDYLDYMPTSRLAEIAGDSRISDDLSASLINNHRLCLHLAGIDREQDVQLWQRVFRDEDINAVAIAAVMAYEADDLKALNQALDILVQHNDSGSEDVDEFAASLEEDLVGKFIACRSREFLEKVLSICRISCGHESFRDSGSEYVRFEQQCPQVACLLKPVVEELSALGRLELVNEQDHFSGDEFRIGDDRFFGGSGGPPDDGFGEFIERMAAHVQTGASTAWTTCSDTRVLTRKPWLDFEYHESESWQNLMTELLDGAEPQDIDYRWSSMYLTGLALNFPGVRLTEKGIHTVVDLRNADGDPNFDIGSKCQFFPPPFESPVSQLLNEPAIQTSWIEALEGLTDDSRLYVAKILARCDRGIEILELLMLPAVDPQSLGHPAVDVAMSLVNLGEPRRPSILANNAAAQVLSDLEFETSFNREPGEAQYFPSGEIEFLLDRHYGFAVVKASRMREIAVEAYLDGLLAEQLEQLVELLVTEDLELREGYSETTRRALRHLASESWRQPLPIRYADYLAEATSSTPVEVVGSFYRQPDECLTEWWAYLEGTVQAAHAPTQLASQSLQTWIAANPWTPADIITSAAAADEVLMRRAAAMNSGCPSATLTILAADPDRAVRTSVWRNRMSNESQRAVAALAGVDAGFGS